MKPEKSQCIYFDRCLENNLKSNYYLSINSSQDQLRRGRQINEPIDIREDASIVLRFTTTVRIRRTDSDPPENRTIKTRVADSTICPGISTK